MHDLGSGAWRLLPLDGIDVNDNDILRSLPIDERKNGWIAHIAAVPIELPIDFHGLKERRQTSRRQHRIDRNGWRLEYLELAGSNIGRIEEQASSVRRAVQLGEVDDLEQRILQRIISKW